MPQEPEPTLSPEAFRLMARELIELELTDEEADTLRDMVNALLAELKPLKAIDTGDVEPAVTFSLDAKGWPR